jgi:hypothetical protein
MDYISRMYNLDVEHKINLSKIKHNYERDMEGIEFIKDLKYNKLIEALTDYTHFNDEIYPSIKNTLLQTYLKEFTTLDDTLDKQMSLEKSHLINKINNRFNNLEDIYNKTLNNNIQSKGLIYPEKVNEDYS